MAHSLLLAQVAPKKHMYHVLGRVHPTSNSPNTKFTQHEIHPAPNSPNTKFTYHQIHPRPIALQCNKLAIGCRTPLGTLWGRRRALSHPLPRTPLPVGPVPEQQCRAHCKERAANSTPARKSASVPRPHVIIHLHVHTNHCG